MNFKTNSTERMRIASGGNVGIGTTSPSGTLDVKGTVYVSGSTSGSTKAISANSTATEVWHYVGSNGAMFRAYNDSANLMHISAAGNVGIGTTAPASPAGFARNTTLYNASSASMVVNAGGAYRSEFAVSSSGAWLGPYDSIPLRFVTGNSERARFTSTGGFQLGQSTTNNPSGTASVTGAGIDPSGYFSANRSSGVSGIFGRISTDGELVRFQKTGSTVGNVSVTASGTTYNTTSDLRLKENIEPLEATDKLMAMNPVSYNWKADPDGPRSMGFIAQEMQEVMPEAVAVGDDEDAMMSMDYGRITPILVSALQDAHRKIEQLETRIAALEAK